MPDNSSIGDVEEKEERLQAADFQIPSARFRLFDDVEWRRTTAVSISNNRTTTTSEAKQGVAGECPTRRHFLALIVIKRM
ncbi:hypothetical protein CRE_10351 [Caenorhabditis remanei]|uniref:Uncharacterized protein n=1 Tax=Caenorhabditis remanei TaxID=31234 RepID=E3MQH6_CAERE|nr:hypothetical protein CRE_10351 [Caenorhabditis remanei]